MHTGVLLFAALVAVAVSDQIPSGFVPLPPIPGNFKPKTPAPPMTPSTKKIYTPKTKVPPKTPPPPITKKPTTVKTNKPTTTKAPLTQRSTQTATQNCQFSFNVPNSNCKGSNSAVQKTLASLRQQLNQARQQHQAQNAALQSVISQLQTQQSGYITKIADLQNEVQNLVGAFNSLNAGQSSSTSAPIILPTSTASSGNPSAVQQAVQNVQTDLRNAVKDLDTKIFNLSLVLNDNQVQESKIHQSIDSQLLRQASDIGRLSQQISDLNRLLQQVQSNTTGSGSAMTKADVARLQAQIQQVSTEIQQYDQQQQSKITNLTSATSTLQATVNQQSSDIQNANRNAGLTRTRLGVAEKDIKQLHDAFARFRQLREPQITQLDKDVKNVTKDVATISSGLKQVQSTTFNFAQITTNNSRELLPLKLKTITLQSTVGNINNELTNQKKEIATLQKGIVDLKNAVPIATLRAMNNIIIQILNNQPVSPQQLTTLKNDLQQLEQRLQLLSLPPVSG